MASIVPVTTEVFDSFTAPTSATSGIGTSDVTINRAYPGLVFAGTEANSVYEEMREVGGDLWIVTNAAYNTTTLQWNPNNQAAAAFAIRLRYTGEFQRLVWPAAAGPITWVLVDTIDAQGAFSITPSTFTTNTEVALSVTPTWNMGIQKATGIKFNVVDTASGANSLLMDLQVGGVSKFRVDKNGVITAGIGTASWLAAVNAVGTATHAWALNDPTGTVALDSIGSSNGTYVGSPNLAAPLLRQTGVGLNGTTQYVTFPTVELPTVAPWSIEVYAASSSSATQTIVSSADLQIQQTGVTSGAAVGGAYASPQFTVSSTSVTFAQSPFGVDSSGNTYVGSTATTVQKYSFAGALLQTITVPSEITAMAVYCDSSGNIWVAQTANSKVLKYNAAGVLQLTQTTNVSGPTGVVVDSSGNFYVANNSSAIYKYPAAGGTGALFATSSSPNSIAIDSSNNIYVSSSNPTNSVYKYNTSGTLTTTYAIANIPTCVAVSPITGNVFVTAPGGLRIYVYANAGGAAITTFNPTTSPANLNAAGIACSPQGEIFANGVSQIAGGTYTMNRFSASLGTSASQTATSVLFVAPSPNHHVVTYDGTTLKYFVDATSAGSAAVALVTQGLSNLTAGTSSIVVPSSLFSGTISNIAIYSSILTGAQISALYQAL